MRTSFAILSVFAGLLAVSCGQPKFGGGDAADKAVKGVFRYPIVTNPTTMDPHKVQDGDTIDLLQQVYEGLVGWGTDNRPTGYLAESWELSPDGLTYTFKLKKATFHNGREVTADDVKWSFERAANQKLASPISDAYLSDIVGFSDKFAGKAQEVAGVKVVDPSTVSITLKAPKRTFLGKLTYLCAAVVPKECFDPETEVSDTAKMIGTGPFKLESFQPNQLVVLAANKDYHGGAPKLEKIERLVLGDAITRLNKFKEGAVDLVMLERQDIAAIEKDEKLKPQLQFFPRPSIFYVGMNQLMYPPFKDKRVRQAFGMAMNRQRYIDDLFQGVNTKANSIVPPGVPGGDRKDAKSLPYDVEAAKKLLADAGFPGGKGLAPLTLTFREDRPDIKLVAEAVAGDLRDNLGIDVKLQSMEWLAYLTKFNAKQQTFYHMRWAADYADPENFLSHMLATWGPENKLGYASDVFDTLCRQADAEQDLDKALPIYAQAEDVVLQDAVWIPIYFQRDAELISTRVKGLRESIFGHLPHTTTSIE